MIRFHYAGVGSRETPAPILSRMRDLACWLATQGGILNSGAADGADSAVEEGCDLSGVPDAKRIWLPWEGFNGRHTGPGVIVPSRGQQAAWAPILRTVHPRFNQLSQGAQRLHLRNYGQAMDALFVLCYTGDGCENETQRQKGTGGTATAIVLADRAGAPVFNLFHLDAEERLRAFVAALLAGPAVHPDGAPASEGSVFVFGSNLAGRHGAGAAKAAVERFGAIPTVGFGPAGMSYAIPTKDGRNGADLGDPSQVLPLSEIAEYASGFVRYARAHQELRFHVASPGCGLAGYTPQDIAPLFRHARALPNCSFPLSWIEPMLGPLSEGLRVSPGINIYSGESGLGGGLTNPTELSFSKGNIKHHYPVEVLGKVYPDAESAYQALKLAPADFPEESAAYNDGLMADLIAAKFRQHPNLERAVQARGGAQWLACCSHVVAGKDSGRWEGYGPGSRFIRNLVEGYRKARTGQASCTRVVHVKEAPSDVYIGRAMPGLAGSPWGNPFQVTGECPRETAVRLFADYTTQGGFPLARIQMLRGKTLGCWCKGRANQARTCHGDVLAALADGRPLQPSTKPAQGELFQ